MLEVYWWSMTRVDYHFKLVSCMHSNYIHQSCISMARRKFSALIFFCSVRRHLPATHDRADEFKPGSITLHTRYHLVYELCTILLPLPIDWAAWLIGVGNCLHCVPKSWAYANPMRFIYGVCTRESWYTNSISLLERKWIGNAIHVIRGHNAPRWIDSMAEQREHMQALDPATFRISHPDTCAVRMIVARLRCVAV